MDEMEIVEPALELTPQLEKEIEKKVAELKAANPAVRAIFPIMVAGNPDYDDKEIYIGYFRQPDLKTFSKFTAASANNQTLALHTLAKDCFLGGDDSLVNDDNLFLFGTMGQLSKIIEMRHGRLVNLSKARK